MLSLAIILLSYNVSILFWYIDLALLVEIRFFISSINRLGERNLIVSIVVGGEALENKKLLVVFTSYYFGDKADKILTELEVPHQLMATPPELYDMCGLSVQIDPSIVEQVQTILKEHKISTSGLFWYEKGELAVPYKA